jgi:precorrin-6A/cobalt-precorrin-6A reductase
MIVNQEPSAMRNILILGGTLEASALAARLADLGEAATLSYAGRVERLKAQPIPTRTGGFGGISGLIAYIRTHAITHLVDATHPFAAQMSRHAALAATATGIGIIAYTRPPWQPVPGDSWTRVPDIPAAVAALGGPAQRVFLALGRMHLDAFAAQPQHHYLLRLVDPPGTPPRLPHHSAVISRGPFTAAEDTALMRQHRITLVVAKNAGGTGAAAKLAAARALRLPVVMIDRPPAPDRPEATSLQQVLAWLGHADTDLGV